MGAALLPLEALSRLADVVLDDVVAQNNAQLVTVGEVLGQAQGIGDTAFAFLVGVVDVLEPKILAVCQ